MANPMAIGVEIPRMDSERPLEKEFTELIHMNHLILLYPTINQVDSCYGYVPGPSTSNTKDTLWMDDHVLTYKSLATRFPKCDRLDTT